MAMAATNQPLPGLHVTAPDEDMEISDYERNGDDIDIDIDLTVDPSHHEDENMDDDRSEHDTRDDVMIDGDGNDDEDGMMQDNMSVPDEHLTDASDVGYIDMEVKEVPQEQPVGHVDIEVQDSAPAEDFIDYDDNVEAQPQVAPEIPTQQPAGVSATDQNQLLDGEKQTNQDPIAQPQISEDIAVPQPSVQAHAPVSVEDKAQEPSSADAQPQEPASTQSGAEQTTEDHQAAERPAEPHFQATSTQSVSGSDAVAAAEHGAHLATEAPEITGQEEGGLYDGQQAGDAAALDASEHQSESQQAVQHAEEVLDFSQLPFDPKNDGETQSSHSGSALHSVVVVYQGDEISLFPPNDSDISDSFYFLQDESLANESVKTLLQACRQVLGETMRDEDELEIDVAELGLCVSEDSQHAANTSFAQILDVYLQLHELDGNQSPGPLYLTLNTKTRFSARLNSLLGAIADGRGMSQLSFLEDVAEEETYAESEVAQEEQGPANQVDEHQQKEHRGSEPEHVSEHGHPPVEESHGSTNTAVEQEQVSHSTAVQPHETQVDQTSHVEEQDAAHEEQSATQQQPEDTTASAQEQYEAHSYVSPCPEELPEYESSDEGEPSGERENEHSAEESSKNDGPAPEDSRENDQIDYDDGENAEDTKDDASYRSSTLQGDNTPATFDESTPQRENVGGMPLDNLSAVSTSIAGLPQEQNPLYDVSGDGLSTEAYGGDHQEVVDSAQHDETQTPNVEVGLGEHGESEQHFDQHDLSNAEEALEQELERELNNQGESFDLPDDYPENTGADHYPTNYDEGGEDYGYEQDEGGQGSVGDEETYEEYVVVEADDVQDNADAPDTGLDGGDPTLPHGDGLDEAKAKEAAENDPDGTYSGLDNGWQDGLDEQAQPNARASDEDDLDTIDYDDEELSQPQSPQQDEAAAQSPSSAKRGWEELDQDDEDQANEQAPKKVKSE
ncbi:hypothetical protein SLS56_005089 [Neofusicoccum ribis]